MQNPGQGGGGAKTLGGNWRKKSPIQRSVANFAQNAGRGTSLQVGHDVSSQDK